MKLPDLTGIIGHPILIEKIHELYEECVLDSKRYELDKSVNSIEEILLECFEDIVDRNADFLGIEVENKKNQMEVLDTKTCQFGEGLLNYSISSENPVLCYWESEINALIIRDAGEECCIANNFADTLYFIIQCKNSPEDVYRLLPNITTTDNG